MIIIVIIIIIIANIKCVYFTMCDTCATCKTYYAQSRIWHGLYWTVFNWVTSLYFLIYFPCCTYYVYLLFLTSKICSNN